MKRYFPLTLLGLLLVLTVSACAAATSESGTRTRQDVLTREEVEAAGVANLYDAIRRLRPRWLNVRSSQSFGTTTDIVVYQGQTMLGGPDVLQQLGPDVITRMRYLDGTTASASLPGLGSRHVAGAIVLETSRP